MDIQFPGIVMIDGVPQLVANGELIPWPGGSGGQVEIPGIGDAHWVTPEWDLGAADTLPRLGAEAVLHAILVPIPINQAYLVKMFLHFESGPVDATGADPNRTYPGSGSGSYQFYLPHEFAWLEPMRLLMYSGNVNLYVEMGGWNDFDGSLKWSYREFTKGYENARPKLFCTFEGDEWQIGKPFPKEKEFKLVGSIDYFVIR